MNFWCRLLGHKVPLYFNRPHYGHVVLRGTDGVGIAHADIHAECDRCYEDFMVIKVHLPKAAER